MPKYRQITVLGVTYNTIRDAWRAKSPEGLAEVTVRARLNAGWSEDEAVLTPRVPAEQRRGYKLTRV